MWHCLPILVIPQTLLEQCLHLKYNKFIWNGNRWHKCHLVSYCVERGKVDNIVNSVEKCNLLCTQFWLILGAPDYLGQALKDQFTPDGTLWSSYEHVLGQTFWDESKLDQCCLIMFYTFITLGYSMFQFLLFLKKLFVIPI